MTKLTDCFLSNSELHNIYLRQQVKAKLYRKTKKSQYLKLSVQQVEKMTNEIAHYRSNGLERHYGYGDWRDVYG